LIPLDIRREMIDKSDNAMSICNQCELLGLARSTLYYTQATTNARDINLMKELDRLSLEDPTRGTRRMTKELKKIGNQVGRTHVRTLMQIMRLKTVYCRPRTTVIDPAKFKFPYLLRNLPIVRPNHDYFGPYHATHFGVNRASDSGANHASHFGANRATFLY